MTQFKSNSPAVGKEMSFPLPESLKGRRDVIYALVSEDGHAIQAQGDVKVKGDTVTILVDKFIYSGVYNIVLGTTGSKQLIFTEHSLRVSKTKDEYDNTIIPETPKVDTAAIVEEVLKAIPETPKVDTAAIVEEVLKAIPETPKSNTTSIMEDIVEITNGVMPSFIKVYGVDIFGQKQNPSKHTTTINVSEGEILLSANFLADGGRLATSSDKLPIVRHHTSNTITVEWPPKSTVEGVSITTVYAETTSYAIVEVETEE